MTRHNDIEREEQLREAEERIKREVIIVDASDEENTEDDEDEELDEENQEVKPKREKTWMLFTTGGILTEGTLPYYRYFIAIAVMCFLSIVLTFLSLNASNEYRRKEHMVTTLHERSVVKDEQRYGLSSKSAIQERLLEHNIELVDLSKNSRLIEK